MAADDRDRQRNDGSANREDPITERLIDEGDRSPEGITAAAGEAFEEDQRNNPDHPTRIQRGMEDASGVQNPAHSRAAGGPDAGEQGESSGSSSHANRDRSDLHGSPTRPAEKTGERGSGRSASTAPSEGRDTRGKQSDA